MLTTPDSPDAEPFRILRSNLEFAAALSEVRICLVTSARAGEGKSTVAANLAAALALAGRRVTLVDLDLRRPSLHRYTASVRVPGVTDVVVGRADLADALVSIPLRMNGSDAVSSLVSTAALTMLPAGSPAPNSGELVASDALRALLDDLRAENDIVIVDSPPALMVSDSVILRRVVDAIVLVADIRKTRKTDIRDLKAYIDTSPARCLGVVVNGVGGDESSGPGYAYVAADEARPRRRRFRSSVDS